MQFPNNKFANLTDENPVNSGNPLVSLAASHTAI
jgi:hypothetical protein